MVKEKYSIPTTRNTSITIRVELNTSLIHDYDAYSLDSLSYSGKEVMNS